MKDCAGAVLYIGKAKNIKKRVSSYFQKRRDGRYQINALVKNTADIEYIVTSSEKEALLLEYNLIRKHKPRYNIFYRDDKSYTNIKLSMGHKYPGIYITRRTPKDGSAYFGPYTSASAARETIDIITRYFKIRNCSDHFFANRSRPCIQYEIARCAAPCVGLVAKEDYACHVRSTEMFLSGNISGLIGELTKRMNVLSAEMRYEEAARIRDAIRSIKKITEPQSISEFTEKNKDYIGLSMEGGRAAFAVMELRGGKIAGYRNVVYKPFHINKLGIGTACTSDHDDIHLWETFLLQYYSSPEKMPDEINISRKIPSIAEIEAILHERKGGRLKVRCPARGIGLKRVKMAVSNAAEGLKRTHGKLDWKAIAKTLMEKLVLTQPPEIVECIDISNISGRFAVGALVSFKGGLPDKSRWRRFKLTIKETPDDYRMMEEVISRYLGNIEAPPDLLLVDGGKGQLSIAKQVANNLGIKNLLLAAIAKGSDKKQDEIYIHGRKNPVRFKESDPCYLFLKRVRDEAHRFGIEYYRSRHRKNALSSILDDLSGIGQSRKLALLKHFGSIQKIREATIDEISKIPGISKKAAIKILNHLANVRLV